MSLTLTKKSLITSPNPEEAVMVRALQDLAGAGRLDLKNTILGSIALIDETAGAFFDIKEFNCKGNKMTVYIKNVPDSSLISSKGMVEYGVMPTEDFSPAR
ncbi:hypothetical protein [Deinococcus hohokamensis]|uniref:Uncharacterized protein n=1 Tax=Deinococcus hohokamensis TaxID=309883 RepID=A0ABV9I7S2_9DEIO